MNKHISYRSSELLSNLLQNDKQFFTLGEAMKILDSSQPNTVRRLLSDMTKRGLILRIKDGLYNIIPYEKNSEEYFPDWHKTAEAIVQPDEYYIGFYSALNIHNLITQPSLTEQVVTEKQIVPKHQTIRNVNFEFITLNHKRFFGYEKTWIDDFNKVYCSDIEKTIIDCLYKPDYAGGITEIVKAIFKCREKIKPDRLIDYLRKFDLQAVHKRLGFLLESLGILKPVTDEIKSKLSSSFTLLDPSLPKEGRHHSEWKIIDNIDIKSALKSLET